MSGQRHGRRDAPRSARAASRLHDVSPYKAARPAGPSRPWSTDPGSGVRGAPAAPRSRESSGPRPRRRDTACPQPPMAARRPVGGDLRLCRDRARQRAGHATFTVTHGASPDAREFGADVSSPSDLTDGDRNVRTMTWVGFDVHARSTGAAAIDSMTGANWSGGCVLASGSMRLRALRAPHRSPAAGQPADVLDAPPHHRR